MFILLAIGHQQTQKLHNYSPQLSVPALAAQLPLPPLTQENPGLSFGGKTPIAYSLEQWKVHQWGLRADLALCPGPAVGIQVRSGPLLFPSGLCLEWVSL